MLRSEISNEIRKYGKCIGNSPRYNNHFKKIVVIQGDIYFILDDPNAYLNGRCNYPPMLYKNSLCIGQERDKYLTVKYDTIEDIKYHKNHDELWIKVKDNKPSGDQMDLIQYLKNHTFENKYPSNILYKNSSLAYIMRYHEIKNLDNRLEIQKTVIPSLISKNSMKGNILYYKNMQHEYKNISGDILKIEN